MTQEELSEFEEMLYELLEDPYHPDNVEEFNEWVHEVSRKLLALAREQFIKEGYVIEKKAFHDAVENISDKHLAEMSVQYSIHCKVEDGTRHAVMNWSEFQKLAQKFIDIGKAEAFNELPRWKTVEEVTTKRTEENDCVTTEPLLVKGWNDGYRILECNTIVNRKMLCIPVRYLKKFLGFKED